MSVLPRQLNYQRPSALPAGTKSTQIVINPNNGSTFSNTGSVIQFDLLQKGFIVPTSMTLSYTINVKSTGPANPEMLGVPAVAPFQRLETIHNGNVIESVNQYNSLYNMLVATKLNAAQILSLATAFGTTENEFGREIQSDGDEGTEFSMAFPLGCLISNCENLFPAAYVGSTRIQLTLDDISNIFARGLAGALGAPTGTVASMTLSNLTLKYDCVEFPAEVDQMVLSNLADETGSIHVKSQTFQTSTQTLPANSSGQQSLIYNARLSSIKSLVAAFQGAGAMQNNGKFDAVDVTSKNGTYQFMLNGNYYPQRPLDTKNDFAGCFLELNSCWSQPHDVLSTNMFITESEYSKNPASETSRNDAAKHFVGVNVENMSGASGTLFSGISSQMSPINLNVNINDGDSGPNARQVDLYICHDAIISINVTMRDLVVKQ